MTGDPPEGSGKPPPLATQVATGGGVPVHQWCPSSPMVSQLTSERGGTRTPTTPHQGRAFTARLALFCTPVRRDSKQHLPGGSNPVLGGRSTAVCPSTNGRWRVEPEGIEPSSPECKTGILPLNDGPDVICGDADGYRPRVPGFAGRRSASRSASCVVVGTAGVAPAIFRLSSGRSAAELRTRVTWWTTLDSNQVLSGFKRAH